jgi:hypothetical protein
VVEKKDVVDVPIKRWNPIWEVLVSNLGWDSILFRGFPGFCSVLPGRYQDNISDTVGSFQILSNSSAAIPFDAV